MMTKGKKRFTAGLLAIILLWTGIWQSDIMQVQAGMVNTGINESTVSGNSISIQDTDEEKDGEGGRTSDDLHIPDTLKKMPIVRRTDDSSEKSIIFEVDHEFMDSIRNYLTDDAIFEWKVLKDNGETERGSEYLFNELDDWDDYEETETVPGFLIEEIPEKDHEMDELFTDLVVSTAEKSDGISEEESNGEYYVRAILKWNTEQQNNWLITTVPLKETGELTEPEREASETEDAEEKKEEELDGESEEKELTDFADDLENDTAEDEESREPIISDMSEEVMIVKEGADAAGEDATEENEILSEDGDETTGNLVNVSKISLSKDKITIEPGETERISVKVVPDGLTVAFAWESSNPQVAAVDSDGVITAMEEGTAVITVSGEGKTAYAEVNVENSDAEKNHDAPTDAEGNVIAISDEVWIAGFERESESLVYTGNKVLQDLRIYHKGMLLKEKTDYTLTYKNNINAATYNAVKAPSVTITMKGQYAGSRTLYFTILPKMLDEEVTAGYEQVVYYAKNIKIPDPALYFGSKKLVKNKDFTCDYGSLPENYTKGNSYEEGQTYEYQVYGKGNYTGSLVMQLSMVRNQNQDFAKASVILNQKQYQYSGVPLTTEEVQISMLKIGKTILEDNLYEYTVTAESAGKGYIEIVPSEEGKQEGYRGKKKLTFTVTGDRSIKKALRSENWQESITFSKGMVIERGGICQAETGILSYQSEDEIEELTEGKDYTVRYTNHKKCGTATAVFTGIGRYTGTVKFTYKIVPNTDLFVIWDKVDENGDPVVCYQKDGAVPSFSLVENTENGEKSESVNKSDYTVKLKNNKKTGIMTCEINGKNNYRGYKSVTEITVIAADISRGTISVSDKAYSKKANAWKSAITIKDVNGKQLKAGTDYDKQLVYTYRGMEEGVSPEAGTIIYVTARGINNYEGSSITGSYAIYAKHINSLSIVIDQQIYTGKEILLSEQDIHVYLNQNARKKGEELSEDCYRIIGYSNNVKAGTGKVVLQGTGQYGGQRTCTFKINKKEYSNIRVKGITLEEKDILLGLGKSRQLTAIISPADAYNQTILWSSSNTKIATVTPDGIVTGLKAGKATIKATAQDTGKSASCKITVAVIRAESFVLNTEEIRQQEGTKYQLTAMEIHPVEADDSTIQWESSNKEVASVDSKGLVSLNNAGMAVISALTEDRKFEQRCLVFVESADEKGYEGDYLTPQMFRRVTDRDDTRAFNEAISKLNDTCDVLYVPAGIYQIDAEVAIKLRSNMKMVMASDAVLQAIGNSSRNYDIICGDNISDVTVTGGQIKGERYEHTGQNGEWGMGIGLYDCKDINISGIAISDCWGDGIYLGSRNENSSSAGCRRITISGCNIFNNRRNNISIVCADYVTVEDCILKDANGTAPQYGIDIEPNNTLNPCEHIEIINSTFEGNGSAAMGIITDADDITISGCTLKGDFINYAGKNVTVSATEILGEVDARIGISMINGTVLNDGSKAQDSLVATFKVDKQQYSIGKYGIDDANQMSFSTRYDDASPSGIALILERITKGTKESGYYFKLSEFMDDNSSALKKGKTYRFEYDVRGTGQWGIKTDQTGWYPCVPMSDKYSTGIVTYTAGSGKDSRLMLYAVDKTEGMYLAVDEIRIYEIN